MFTKNGTRNILFNTTTTTYSYTHSWSLATANWTVARPTAGAWTAIVLTYDPSATTNDPVVYFNGTSQTVTEVTAPLGTVVTDNDTWEIGNRDDGLRVWDGSLGGWAVWSRILPAAEATAVSGGGYSPLHFQNGLLDYMPMESDFFSFTNPGTISVIGTLPVLHAQNDPPRNHFRQRTIGHLLGRGVLS